MCREHEVRTERVFHWALAGRSSGKAVAEDVLVIGECSLGNSAWGMAASLVAVRFGDGGSPFGGIGGGPGG